MKKKGKKTVRVEKYDPSYTDRVGKLISGYALNREGGLAFGKIAKGLGVSARTMLKWRTKGQRLYKPDFVKAIKEAEAEKRKKIAEHLESVELGKVHAGVVKRAQGYRKRKLFRVMKVVGPAHPPYSRFTKADLITYAKNALGLKLDKKKLKKGGVENAIRKRIDVMTTEELQTVRVEEEFVPSDITAAKYCDQNMGKAEERWKDLQKVEVGGEDGKPIPVTIVAFGEIDDTK